VLADASHASDYGPDENHGGDILDNLLDVLTKLIPLATPLVPGAGAAPEIVAAVAALIKHIQQQTGKTTDQILADAEATLDANDKMLLEDRIRLGM
jgi:hypothetical protein